MSPATAFADEASLACPHPGCRGSITPNTVEELWLCPLCGRASARCVRETRAGRCPSLNHPLALYCRRCGTELGRDWPRDLWSGDLAGPRNGEPILSLREPVVVHDFDADRRLDSETSSPPTLLEAAGELWVAWGDGRTLLRLNPGLTEATGKHCGFDQPQATSKGPSTVRLHASGPWLTVTSEAAIRVVDILGIDAFEPDQPWQRLLWKPLPGERLAAGPILLPDPGDPMARRVVWLIARGEALALGVASLSDASPERSVGRFAIEGDPRPTAEPDGPAPTLATDSSGRGSLILAAREGLYLVALPDSPRESVVARRFWDCPLPLDGSGIVVVPGRGESDRPDLPSYVFAAGRDDEGALLAILRPETDYPPNLSRGRYLPRDVVRQLASWSALALDGQSLVLIGTDGKITRVTEAPALERASEVRVHGRLALASVQEGGAKNLWVALVCDLRAGRLVGIDAAGAGATRLVSTRPASGLVPLGRYLYRVAESHEGRLCLLRYLIEITGSS